ncbi:MULTISPECIES: hypothetical protein [Streptomyces]|uniref:Kazal-like domain-containing protein n=1 Tax=Streptomyces luteosporeus TaxID=173856 RepID=A0ABN3TMN0_9ACTN
MRKLVAPFATLLLTGAAGLAFGAPAHATAPTAVVPVVQECPGVCATVYDPVVCLFSDGSTARFSNQCFAEVHACNHNLRILRCARVKG